MKEVRVCWQPSLVHDGDYDEHMQSYGMWRVLNSDILRNMKNLCTTANRVYGANSHWLEIRSMTNGPERLSPAGPTPNLGDADQ